MSEVPHSIRTQGVDHHEDHVGGLGAGLQVGTLLAHHELQQPERGRGLALALEGLGRQAQGPCSVDRQLADGGALGRGADPRPLLHRHCRSVRPHGLERRAPIQLDAEAHEAGPLRLEGRGPEPCGDPQGAAGRGRAEVDLHLRPDADVPAGEGAGVEVPSLGGREGVHADGLLGVASWRGREHGGRLRHQEQGRVHPLDREAPDLDLLYAAPAADEAREGEGHDPARAAHRPDPSEPAPAASRSGASPAGCPRSRRR